jgi:hypothetical protein
MEMKRRQFVTFTALLAAAPSFANSVLAKESIAPEPYRPADFIEFYEQTMDFGRTGMVAVRFEINGEHLTNAVRMPGLDPAKGITPRRRQGAKNVLIWWAREMIAKRGLMI